MEFKLWFESTLLKKKFINRDFMKRLGLAPDTLEKQDIDMEIIPKSKFVSAIDQMPITDDEKNKLKGLIMPKPKGSLKSFVNQINPLAVQEKQDKAFTYPAYIPQGQQPAPKPMNPQQMQQMQPQQPQQPQLGY